MSSSPEQLCLNGDFASAADECTACDQAGFALASLIDLLRIRRSVRHFRPDPVPPELLAGLLEAARWAPSGFNLQPTHFVVVTDPVFTGDRRAAENHLDRVLRQDLAAGAINAPYERKLRWGVPLLFNEGPLGLGRLWKAALAAVLGRFKVLPPFQAIDKDYWLGKQVCMSAMAFLLAAEAAGLAACPMEGFSDRRVRRVLGVPPSQLVVLAIPVGYSDDPTPKRSRLPLDGRVHPDRW
jgi:nitroreductase